MKPINDIAGGPQKPQMNVDISQAKDVVCQTEGCEGKLFLPAARFKKLSKILTGAAQDAMIPIDVFVCAKCGAVLEELLPRGLDN